MNNLEIRLKKIERNILKIPEPEKFYSSLSQTIFEFPLSISKNASSTFDVLQFAKLDSAKSASATVKKFTCEPLSASFAKKRSIIPLTENIQLFLLLIETERSLNRYSVLLR